ncbi:MAG: hypothetical protein J5529_07425 [Prevotella sp.]|nr:hypothetical protein [Prevotella sp.]
MKFDILKPETIAGPGNNDMPEIFIFPAKGEASIHDKLFILAHDTGKGSEQSMAGEYFARSFADTLFQNTCPDEPMTEELMKEALLAAREMVEEKCPEAKGVQFAALYMHRHGCLAAHLGNTRIYHVRPKGRKMLYKSRNDERVFSTKGLMEEPVKAFITNVQYGDYFVLMAGEGCKFIADQELMDAMCEPVNDKTKTVRLKKMAGEGFDNFAATIVHISGVMNEAMDEGLFDNEARLSAAMTTVTPPTPFKETRKEEERTPPPPQPKVEKPREEWADEEETVESKHDFPIVTVTALALVLMAFGIWYWAQKPNKEEVVETPVEVKKPNEKDTINILKNTRPKPVNIDDPKAKEKEEEKKAEEKPKTQVEKISADDAKPDTTVRPSMPSTPAPVESSAPQNVTPTPPPAPTPTPPPAPANQTTTPPPAGNNQGGLTPRPVIPEGE